MSSQEDAQWRERRSSVIIIARITTPDGRVTDRRLRNLSCAGGRIDHAGELSPGMTVRVQIGAVPECSAEVVWAEARAAGLRFARPVELEAARQPRSAVPPAIATAAHWQCAANHQRRRD